MPNETRMVTGIPAKNCSHANLDFLYLRHKIYSLNDRMRYCGYWMYRMAEIHFLVEFKTKSLNKVRCHI